MKPAANRLRRTCALGVAAGFAVVATVLSSPAAHAAPAPPILVLGDSLCVGAVNHGGHLGDELRDSGWSPEFVCQTGEAVGWGINQVRARRSVPATVVVQLGTNPSSATAGFASQIGTMRAELRARGAVDIVWVTFADRADRYEPKAQIVRDLASASPSDDLRVADWAERLRANPQWFHSDGLHYNATGLSEFAQFIASSVSRDRPMPPFATVADLVERQYRDLLSRSPDTAGAGYWEAMIGSGQVSRDRFVAQLVASPEFGGRIAPIVRLYQAAFGRVPDRAGLLYWAQSGHGVSVIAGQLSSSPEFHARYGQPDDAAFVRRLYLNVLGREPDAAGGAFWRRALAAGVTRGEVMAGLGQSDEFVAQFTPQVNAVMLYVGLLGRDAEPAGFGHWTTAMVRGTPFTSVVAQFLDSAEYRARIARLGYATA